VDVHIRKFDAADEESVKAVVNDAIKEYGRLDIFFANAGVVGQPKLFTDITAEEALATLRTNVVRYENLASWCISLTYLVFLWLQNMPHQPCK